MAIFTQWFRQLENINSAATAILARPVVYERLYLSYHTSQNFMPQFQQNLQIAKAFLQRLMEGLGGKV